MKKALSMIAAMLLIDILYGCSASVRPDGYLGFSKQDFTVVDEMDHHGGLHGDWYYYLILDCSDHTETALKNVEGWKKLPLSENLDMIMYSREKDDIHYMYNLSEEAHMPEIENGYYYFMDQDSESEELYDDSELLNHYVFNFTLAVYDSDTDIFYYFEFYT